MKTNFFFLAVMLSLGSLSGKAQFVVTDPAHIVTSIVNAANQIVQTSSTAANMIKNFQEVKKVYDQGKEYYDKLKAVNNLVKDAKKVREIVLMVGDISDCYIENYQRMLTDPHFSVQELGVIATGYNKLLQNSGDALRELKDVINENGLSMNDKERIDLIDRVYNVVKRQRNLVDYYTRKTISVSYLRAKKAKDTDRLMALYGTAEERYW